MAPVLDFLGFFFSCKAQQSSLAKRSHAIEVAPRPGPVLFIIYHALRCCAFLRPLSGISFQITAKHGFLKRISPKRGSSGLRASRGRGEGSGGANYQGAHSWGSSSNETDTKPAAAQPELQSPPGDTGSDRDISGAASPRQTSTLQDRSIKITRIPARRRRTRSDRRCFLI